MAWAGARPLRRPFTIAVSPSVWKSKRDLPPTRTGNASKRQAGGFPGSELGPSYDGADPASRKNKPPFGSGKRSYGNCLPWSRKI